jgi:hypothetical protein
MISAMGHAVPVEIIREDAVRLLLGVVLALAAWVACPVRVHDGKREPHDDLTVVMVEFKAH